MKTLLKRLLTMLLAAAMIFGLSGMTTFAAETDDPDSRDITAESEATAEEEAVPEAAREESEPEIVSDGPAFPEIMPFFLGDAETLANGSPGRSGNAYLLEDLADLEWFAAQVNSKSNGENNTTFNAILGADIDATGSTCFPIGKDADGRYNGNFDGNGHTITVDIESSDIYTAVFGYKGEGSIENLTVAGSVTGGQYSACIVGLIDSTGCITNCVNEATGTFLSHGNCGGIVGYVYALDSITDCVNKGDITSETSQVAGIAGYVLTNKLTGVIDGCFNYGSVTCESSAAGGIVGSTYDTFPITNCGNEGPVTGTYYVGGILGDASADVNISNCYNRGDITASSSGHVAGILGYVNYTHAATIDNCYNTGTIRAAKTTTQNGAAGIIGSYGNNTVSGDVTRITNVFNTGTIEVEDGTEYYGALVGCADRAAYFLTLSNGYYLTGSAASDHPLPEDTYGHDYVETENVSDKSAGEIRSVEFLELLNQNGGSFKKGCEHPVLLFETAGHQFDLAGRQDATLCSRCGEIESITINRDGETSQLSYDTIDTAIAQAPVTEMTDGDGNKVNAQFADISELLGISDKPFVLYSSVTCYDGEHRNIPREACLYWYIDGEPDDNGFADYYRVAVDGGSAEDWCDRPIVIDVLESLEVSDVTITSNIAGDTKTYDGAEVVLRASATVAPEDAETTWQWYKDGAAIEDANDPELVLAGDVADSGEYTCEVTAAMGGMTATKSASATITIEQAAQSISYETILATRYDYDKPFTHELTVGTVSSDDGAGIRYASSDESVAKVDDETGEVTIVGPGTAIITATAVGTANYTEASASYVLLVNEDVVDTEFKVDDGWVSWDEEKGEYRSGTTYTGEDMVLEMVVTLTDEETAAGAKASYQWYRYVPEDEAFVKIDDATGAVYTLEGDAVDAGDYIYLCVAVVTFGNGYEHTVYSPVEVVIEPAAQEISYEKTSVEKTFGEDPYTNELTTGILSGEGITYESSDPGVATVDEETGEVMFVGAGTTTITATAAGSKNYKEAGASYTLTVKEADKAVLAAAIASTEKLDEDNYTKSSWDALQDALTKAKDVEADPCATQDAVNTAASALLDALAGLEAETPAPEVDKTVLDAAIATAESLDKDNYTKASWDALQTVLDEAVRISEDADATQEAVNDAAEALVNALAGLAAETPAPAVNKNGLVTAIEAAEALDKDNYTEASRDALETALGEAVRISEDADATQEAVNAATSALVSAIAGLEAKEAAAPVDKSVLDAAIGAAEALDKDNYTEVSWEALETALGEAVKINKDADATQGAVNTAAAVLVEALAGLEANEETPAPAVDKSVLDAAIESAEKLDPADYTESSWNTLQTALGDAREVSADPDAAQEAVNTAAVALVEALAGLEANEETPAPAPADKADLLKEYTEGMGLTGSGYTAESWAPFANALAAAQAVLLDADATQDAVEAAEEALKTAKDNLEPVQQPAAGPKNGLCMIEKGVRWGYYVNGEVDTGFTGFVRNDNGDWYVQNGYVIFADPSEQGVFKDTAGAIGAKGTWYYVTGGKVQYGFTGLAHYRNQYGWWYITDGVVDFTHNGVDKNQNGWWYVKNGKVEFGHNGVDKNANGWWYITGGKVRFDFTGLGNYRNQNGWWYISGGKVDFSHSGVDKNKNGWWYVHDGKVDFNFTGIASNRYGTWYINGGKVRFDYNDTVTAGGRTYTVRSGKVR